MSNFFPFFYLDLKTDNIVMGFEDPAVIQEYVQFQADNPMSQKFSNGHTIYRSRNNFGALKSYGLLPKIVDFDLAEPGNGPEPLRHPIQPILFQAPEVLFGIPWSYSADIWNFGVMVCFQLVVVVRISTEQNSNVEVNADLEPVGKSVFI